MPSQFAEHSSYGGKPSRKRGSILVFMIMVMLVASGLMFAAMSQMSVTSFSEAVLSRTVKAKYLAQAGVNYFKALNDTQRQALSEAALADRTFAVADGSFTLFDINHDSADWYFYSRGVASSGQAFESSQVLANVKVGMKAAGADRILDMKMDAVQSGNSADSSVINNNGSVKGSVAVTQSASDAKHDKSIKGNAYEFTQRGRVVTAYNVAYDVFFNGTISVWLKPYDFNNTVSGILHKGVSSVVCKNGILADEVYTLQYWPSGSGVVFRMLLVEGSSNDYCTPSDSTCLCSGDSSWRYVYIDSSKVFTSSSDANKWVHVLVTWERQSNNSVAMKFYINGSQNATKNVGTFNPRRNKAPLVIGSQTDSDSASQTFYYKGLMDELIVWNRALSASEVRDLFLSQRFDYCSVSSHSRDSVCTANP